MNETIPKAIEPAGYEPTRQESALLTVLLNPEYARKSISDKCQIAGVSRTLYYDSIGKPEFMQYYKEQARKLVDDSIGPIINIFVREALKGSFQHGKVLLEMSGLYSEHKDNGTKIMIVNLSE